MSDTKSHKIPRSERTKEKAKDPSDPQFEIESLEPQIASIVGGDNTSSDQMELLKRYISLKENEVRDLREQLKQFQSLLTKLSLENENYSQKNRDLLLDLESAKKHEDILKSELFDQKQKYDQEIAIVKNDADDKLKKVHDYELQMNDLSLKKEEWKERIREDLKRIKLKERELENKYELLKRDTGTLLDSKDKHLLELKNKNDAFELEMEALEERLRKSNTALSNIDAKKQRLVETLKLAISLLEEIDSDANKKAG